MPTVEVRVTDTGRTLTVALTDDQASMPQVLDAAVTDVRRLIGEEAN